MSNNLVIQPNRVPTGIPAEYKEMAKVNATFSDEQLQVIAMQRAGEDVKKSKTAKLYKAMPLITSAGLVSYYTLTKQGPLSAKVGAGAAIAGIFAGIDIGLKAYNKIKNKIKAKQGDKEPKQSKHPIAKTLLSIAGIFAAVGAGYYGITKGASAFTKTDLGTKIVAQLKGLGEKIDASNFAKKIKPEAIDGFFTKHPSAKSALFWVPLVGSLTGSSLLAGKLNNKFQENATTRYAELANQRNTSREIASGVDTPLERALARQDGLLANLTPKQLNEIPKELLLQK